MAHPATIDAYLARLPDDQRRALEKIRKAILAAAPRAEECFSYGLPAFRDTGGLLAGFGASTKHCAYYPMSGSVVRAFASELEGYATSKGAIRFDAARPLPATHVRKLVKARQIWIIRLAQDGSGAVLPDILQRQLQPAMARSSRRSWARGGLLM